jgi:preprotein translocase subunit YajC
MTGIALIQAGGGGGTTAFIVQILPFLAIFAIFYFLVIAPASRQRKKTAQMLEALKRGDRVITTGGIFGSIQAVEGETVHLKIADNVKVKVLKSSIASVTNDATGE